MERPLSQHDAALLERRRQPDRRSVAADDRLVRHLQPRRPRCRAPASTTSPCTTASRWPTWSATTRSTTTPMARTIATAPTTITATIAASKARPTIATILALRRQLRKNQLACLFLAQGVPLLLAGDEVGNTQDGNNNAYCQDNEIGWVDWDGLDREDDDLIDFVGLMTRAAPPLSAAALAALARRPARRRQLRRPVADAVGGRNDRAGLGVSGRRAFSPMCWLRRSPTAARAVHRAEFRRRDDPVSSAEAARISASGISCSTPPRTPCRSAPLPSGSETVRAAALGAWRSPGRRHERPQLRPSPRPHDGVEFPAVGAAAPSASTSCSTAPHPMQRGEGRLVRPP